MARVKLTEFRAKSLLVNDYRGISICSSSVADDISKFDHNLQYVVKVDQGIKKRGKRGLIRYGVTIKTAIQAVGELTDLGFERFIAEPMLPHDDSEEQYLSIERVRNGFKYIFSRHGGVEVEEHSSDIEQFDSIDGVPLPRSFLEHLTACMNKEHMSFLEINPIIIRDDSCILLDAAVLVDSAGSWQSSWSDWDIVEDSMKVNSERTIAKLNEGSAASFSFKVLNPNGSVWLLLSGGGASITIADEAANRGKADAIGNYGEYSGGPTREEAQLYTGALIKQALLSSTSKKAIIIAGGVANFTDVKKTFAGVIDALKYDIKALQEAKVKIFVRRGGPNEKEGLKLMEDFLKKHNIYGSVYGSDKVLTIVVDEALEYVDA